MPIMPRSLLESLHFTALNVCLFMWLQMEYSWRPN